MLYKMFFKRYELKYLLSENEKQAVLAAMQPHMHPDSFGRSCIRNLYYDTDNYRLIRRSIEKPVYKEKLRVRSYGEATQDSTVFVELKKKYDSVVYKRRIGLPEHEAMAWLSGHPINNESQTAREIEYFRDCYGKLNPAVFLSYEREAFFADNDDDFRITFDENILYRQDELSLRTPAWGTPLLEPGQTLMEIKASGGIPLWMAHTLSENSLFQTSFSKYGAAYRDLSLQEHKGALQYA